MKSILKNTQCRIERRADKQGSRPAPLSRDAVEKCATGCDTLEVSTRRTGPKTLIEMRKNLEKSSTEDTSRRRMKNIRKKTVNIRIATINVRTCQDDLKLASIVKAARDLKIDILAMQEMRRISYGSIIFDDDSIKDWQMVWSGHKRKREHGVAILLAPYVNLEEFQEHLAARIISAKVRVHGMRLSILNAYAPTDVTVAESTKTTFYSALTKAKKTLEKNPKFKIVTLGDFNATISSQSKGSGVWDEVIGHNNSDRVNTSNNGERLLSWCMKNRIKLVNTIFRTKRIHRETWQHAATRQWKRLDYIGTTDWVLKFVRSCRVYIGPSSLFDTDHRLLVMNIDFPDTKREIRHHLSRAKSNEERPRTDFTALRDNPDVQQRLTANLEERLSNIDCDDVDEINERIVTTVRESVKEVCPKIMLFKKLIS